MSLVYPKDLERDKLVKRLGGGDRRSAAMRNVKTTRKYVIFARVIDSIIPAELWSVMRVAAT